MVANCLKLNGLMISLKHFEYDFHNTIVINNSIFRTGVDEMRWFISSGYQKTIQS